MIEYDPAYAPKSIALVGHLSRTWTSDKQLLVDLLDERGVQVTTHGSFGFDLMVEEVMFLLGIQLHRSAVTAGCTRKERFGYRTDPRALCAWQDALVVMTRRKHPDDVFDVDPNVVEQAVQQGLPVFALDEEGVMKLWP